MRDTLMTSLSPHSPPVVDIYIILSQFDQRKTDNCFKFHMKLIKYNTPFPVCTSLFNNIGIPGASLLLKQCCFCFVLL